MGRRWLTPERLVDALVFAGQKGDFLDHFAKVVRDFARAGRPRAIGPGFLRGDRHSFLNRGGIVGANFAPMRSLSGVMILPRAV